MKRFLNWIFERFDKEQPAAQKPRQSAVPRRPKPVAKKVPEAGEVTYATRMDGKIADGGPGKNVFVRSKMIREETGTHDILKIVDESIVEPNDEGGIDPYNTGRFDRAKSWDATRSRK